MTLHIFYDSRTWMSWPFKPVKNYNFAAKGLVTSGCLAHFVTFTHTHKYTDITMPTNSVSLHAARKIFIYLLILLTYFHLLIYFTYYRAHRSIASALKFIKPTLRHFIEVSSIHSPVTYWKHSIPSPLIFTPTLFVFIQSIIVAAAPKKTFMPSLYASSSCGGSNVAYIYMGDADTVTAYNYPLRQWTRWWRNFAQSPPWLRSEMRIYLT